MVRNHLAHDLGFAKTGETMEPQEHDAVSRSALTEDQLSEILIFGKKRCGDEVGLGEHLIVRDARSQLGDVNDRMTIGAQTMNNLHLDAFVANEVHAAVSGTG